MTIQDAFAELVKMGRYNSESNTELLQLLSNYGMEVAGTVATVPKDVELLNELEIANSLAHATKEWLVNLGITPVVGSTNSSLVDLAARRSIDGEVLLAEVQTGGRGRRGRNWYSPFGRNIALSIGFRLNSHPAQTGSLSLVVGVAVAEALESMGVDMLKLKWPNDLLIDGAKVGGILIELVGASQPVELVIGIGINVEHAPDLTDQLAYEATALIDHKAGVKRSAVVISILDNVVAACKKFEAFGFEQFREEFQKRDWYIDRQVRVSGIGSVITGIAQGVDEQGALLVKTASGSERIIGGDVSLRIA